MEVLAGTLLTLVEPRKYHHGITKYVLEIVDQESTVLESQKEDLNPLTPIQFELLRAVPSCSERLAVFNDQEWLSEGETLKIGCRVQVQIKGQPQLGVIRCRISVDGCIYFGIELLVSI